MKTFTNRIISGALVVALAVLPVTTVRATAVIAATEPTQILNNIQLLSSYVEQANQTLKQATIIYNQLQAYANMLQNTKNIAKYDITNITTSLANLRKVVATAKGLQYSVSNINTLFDATHKGFKDFLTISTASADQAKQLAKWADLHKETTTTALKELNLHEDDFDDENATLDTIKSQLTTTDGTVKAVTVGSEIALQNTNQLQQLRRLTMNQIQMEARYNAIAQEKEDMKAATGSKMCQGFNCTLGSETTF